MLLKEKLRIYRDSFYLHKKNVAQEILKIRLQNKNFTIIANNCWGGEIYRALNLPYKTPFIGLFLFAPCYIRLLKNLKTYLNSELNFTKLSQYKFVNQQREQGIWDFYPIGLLNDVEIHFMHYFSESEAREKWLRRLGRIDWEPENLFLKFCDRGFCTQELITEFERLDYSQKVCFTSKNYPELKSTVWIEECKNDPYVVDGKVLHSVCRKYFDAVDWLNGGNGHIKFFQKFINKLDC